MITVPHTINPPEQPDEEWLLRGHPHPDPADNNDEKYGCLLYLECVMHLLGDEAVGSSGLVQGRVGLEQDRTQEQRMVYDAVTWFS